MNVITLITQTGAFGILWILSLIIFIYVFIKFWKRNGVGKLIVSIIPVILILFLINWLAKELTGLSNFDMALELLKDMWFMIGHVFITTVLIASDKGILGEEDEKTHKHN